jgi:glutamate carboxypeptidase
MAEAGGRDERIVSWLASSGAAMEGLLARIVDIDSPSGYAAGIDAVGNEIAAFLVGEGVAVERVTTADGAALLKAEVAGGDGVPALLMGHMDTVFPRGAAAARPFRACADRLHGPGVADMKGGLVLNAFVLAAFARFGDRNLRGLFTIDEEVASPASRETILDMARSAAFVLNAEPGRRNGNVVIERKGGLFLRIDVAGRSAHAGVDFTSGASAIGALARKIVALETLTDLKAGITVNVGLVSGGQSINTVAPSASASVDIRYARAAERTPILDRVARIVATADVAETRAAFVVLGEFLPMMPSPDSLALLATYRAVAARLGFDANGEATGGCSDAGLTATLGVPTLCGTGPVGGKAHTEDEYVERASLVGRAQAVALVVLNHPSTRPKTAATERNPLVNQV